MCAKLLFIYLSFKKFPFTFYPFLIPPLAAISLFSISVSQFSFGRSDIYSWTKLFTLYHDVFVKHNIWVLHVMSTKYAFLLRKQFCVPYSISLSFCVMIDMIQCRVFFFLYIMITWSSTTDSFYQLLLPELIP